jgi:predicted nucleic acid-binding protein
MPDADQVVIADTTPLISLSVIGHLHILESLYGKVLIPPAVEDELFFSKSGRPGFIEVMRPVWIDVIPLRAPKRANLLADLDRGEAEVIALALERNADLIILDERLARQYARRLELMMTGTLGVLLKAKQQGLLSELRPLINELRQNKIRLSEAVIAEALRLADEESE